VRRRDVLPLLGAGLAWPITASTQQSGSAVRIGYLMAGARDGRIMRENTEAFRRGMLEFGYVEGRDLTIDYRFAEGDFERLPAMAAELVRGNPAVIVSAPTPAAVAAKNATSTIPIVMISVGGPEDLGLVQSLAHPGGKRSRPIRGAEHHDRLSIC
jgi:putative ABC transport system substrate-binding protein